jgi:hypothetical protein
MSWRSPTSITQSLRHRSDDRFGRPPDETANVAAGDRELDEEVGLSDPGLDVESLPRGEA